MNIIKTTFRSATLVAAILTLAGCEGPVGPAGPQGPAGEDGMSGADGTDGSNGTDGMSGSDGMDGSNGTDGSDGMDGSDGSDGMNGSDGTDGVDGSNAYNFAFLDEDPSAYVQVDRIGMPAIATALISSKDLYNESTPLDDLDGLFVDEIVASVDFFHAALDEQLIGLGLTPCIVEDCVAAAAPLIIPDTVSIDTSGAAGFPNGRGLADQAIDVTLGLALLDLTVHDVTLLASLPLNPPANDRGFLVGFPYLAAPH